MQHKYTGILIIAIILLIPSVIGPQDSPKQTMINLDTMNFRFFGVPIKGDTFVTLRESRKNVQALFEEKDAEMIRQRYIHELEHQRWKFIVDSLADVIKKERLSKLCRIG